ncbi:MAG: TIGR02099 family protein [Rhodocyclaceae bacterium]|nr:TIGR02099 family protein [Rhodocyclaceae bacterium]
MSVFAGLLRLPVRLYARAASLLPARLRAGLYWGCCIALIVLSLAALTLRYVVLPRVDEHRADIAAAIGKSMGLRVEIDRIEASWHGLHPELDLYGFKIFDKTNRLALLLNSVHTQIAWSSFALADIRLYGLELRGVHLDLRRDPAGHIFVAGLEVGGADSSGGIADWVLAQKGVVVRNAALTWSDEMRGAPLLALTDLQFRLENRAGRHRFGLQAKLPDLFAAPVDVRGDFHGRGFAQLPEWKGGLYVALAGGNFDALRQWLDFPPALDAGKGDLRLWASVDARILKAATADVNLREFSVKAASDLPALKFTALTGRLAFKHAEAALDLDARRLYAAGTWGRFGPTDVKVEVADIRDGVPGRGTIAASRVDLAAWSGLAAGLPLAPEVRAEIAQFQPRGVLDDLSSSWQRQDGKPTNFTLKTAFKGLGMRAVGLVPGYSGLDGTVDANQAGGTLALDARKAGLDMPRVFEQSNLDLERLLMRLNWAAKDGGLQFNLSQAEFSNRDATGSASGHYFWRAGSKGSIDLQARLARADGASVWRYLPLVVSGEVREWLHQAIPHGRASDARLQLRGDLEKFPFRAGRDGVFRVSAKVDDVRLDYASGWPEIQNIQGSLLFEGERMLIAAQRARLLGAALNDVSAEIRDLEAAASVLLVKGRAAGPTAEFFRFIEHSPVSARIDHFTDDMQAAGNGSLKLALTLPLDKIEDSRVTGDFEFAGNRLTVDPALPVLTDAAGRVEFSEKALSIRGAQAKMLGMPLKLNVSTREDGAVNVNVEGSADIANLRRQLPDVAPLQLFSGSTGWRAKFALRGKSADVTIDSNLVGISSRLPDPFGKQAADSLPLRVERSEFTDGARRDARLQPSVRESWKLSLGRVAQAQMLRRRENQALIFERAAVGVGTAPELPEKGTAVSVVAQRVDLDAWRALQTGAASGNSAGGLGVSRVNLKAGAISGYGHELNDATLKLSRRDNGWYGEVDSREALGNFLWREQDQGRFEARFKRLALNPAKSADPGSKRDPVRELPGIDLEVENLQLRGRDLGSLQLLADNRNGEWLVEKFLLHQPDADFSGEGKWRPQGATQVRFKLESGDVGKMLTRIGYADVVARGTAKLEGRLGWQGSPLQIDYPSLQGALRLDAANGQFAKINPGAGRLLGILSLQSLPRRITLDFRDIFSEGLAFDTIGGELDVARGIITTQDLSINAPAAKIAISGQADLGQETQNLLVRVQPALSSSVAVGALLAHPVAGVAAYLAQKVLRDPLDQIFAYQYSVTGAWSDPKVERIAKRNSEAPGAMAEETAKK